MSLAFLIPVFSFVACPAIILLQRWLPLRGAALAILAIAAGFGLWVWALADFLGASDAVNGCEVSGLTGALTCHFSTAWFEAGLPGVAASVDQAIHLEWGILIDPLTVVLLGLVTFVALGVQLYSLDYMKGDARFGWYFAWQALFVAAMLTLVLADNFLLLYIAWELVGLCSYLLIGFWFENPGPREAAKKAFVVTRIGDVGLLVGILLLWVNVGSFSMSDAFAAAQSGTLGSGVTTAAALLLLLGAMGEIGAVSVSRVAAGCYGGAHSGERLDPRGHDGYRGGLPGGSGLSDLRGVSGSDVGNRHDRIDYGAWGGHHRPGVHRPETNTGILNHFPPGIDDAIAGSIRLDGGGIPPDGARIRQGAAVPGGRECHARGGSARRR